MAQDSLVSMGSLESGANEIAPTPQALPSTGLFGMGSSNQQQTDWSPQPILTPVPKVQGPDTGTTILSILAAAKGNFGPLWDISEQKRKTQNFTALGTIVANADRIANNGDPNKALEYFNENATKLGARAPEIAQMIPQYLQRFNVIQDRMNNQRNLVTQLEAMSEQAKAFGNEDLAKFYKGGATLAKKFKVPMNEGQIESFRKTYLPEVQVDPARSRSFLKTPFGTITTSVPENTAPGDFGSDTGQARILNDPELKAALGGRSYTIPDLVNILNSNDPRLNDIKNLVAQKQAEALDYERRLKIAQNVPLPPEATMGMISQGANAQDIALRENLGPNKGNVAGSALDYVYEKQKQIASANVEALMDHPVSASYPNLVAVTNDPKSEYHGQADAGITLRNAIPSKDKSILPREVYYGQVVPTFKALDGLSFIDAIFDPLRNPQGQYDQITAGLATEISKVLGISLSPGMSKSFAARAIVEQALNQVDDLKAVSRKATGDLRRIATGAFNDPESAKKAIEEIQERVNQELGRFMNQNKIPASELKAPITPEPQRITVNPTGKVVDQKGNELDRSKMTPQQQESLDALQKIQDEAYKNRTIEVLPGGSQIRSKVKK